MPEKKAKAPDIEYGLRPLNEPFDLSLPLGRWSDVAVARIMGAELRRVSYEAGEFAFLVTEFETPDRYGKIDFPSSYSPVGEMGTDAETWDRLCYRYSTNPKHFETLFWWIIAEQQRQTQEPLLGFTVYKKHDEDFRVDILVSESSLFSKMQVLDRPDVIPSRYSMVSLLSLAILQYHNSRCQEPYG